MAKGLSHESALYDTHTFVVVQLHKLSDELGSVSSILSSSSESELANSKWEFLCLDQFNLFLLLLFHYSTPTLSMYELTYC